MQEKTRFLIYTLSVKNIIEYCRKKEDDKKSGKISYVINLADPFDIDRVVLSKDYVEDSAYIYQALRLTTGSSEKFYEVYKNKDKYKYEEFLLKKLVILNFSNVFPGNTADGKKILERGIEIQFPDEMGVKYAFEAGDKSSSMAKANKIYFVNSEYKEKLFKRLMLGFDYRKDYNIQTKISKLYAYRGLYLSDSTRIHVSFDERNGALLLNPQSVIVIRDSKYKCVVADENKKYITAEPDGLDLDGKQRWKMREKTEQQLSKKDKYHINAFDGEGLICKSYADEINRQLKMQNGTATSFQIRMPFVKGMLHQVEWMDVIADIACEAKLITSENKENLPELYIEDIFGKVRKLSDAKIILTESMFKCKDWFKNYYKALHEENPERFTDEMQLYFDRMKMYEHSLYISQTDFTQIKNKGLTVLNYQFLNPLAISTEEFACLIESQNARIRDMNDDPAKVMFETNFPKQEEFDESSSEEEDIKNKNEEEEEFEGTNNKGRAWIKALESNEAFINDVYIRQKLMEYQRSLVRDIVMGRLIVRGEIRYLSGDLLGLIADIIGNSFITKEGKSCTLEDKVDLLKKTIRNKCLYRDEFFLPASNLKLKFDSYLAFLRNPHLSKYEEYLLQPKRKVKKAEEDLYLKHFGHLKGLVMVGRKSMAPIALGGADFDGDIVRIIENPTVVEAIKKGTLTERNTSGKISRIIGKNKGDKFSKKNTSRGVMDRNVPYISIPSPSAEDRDIVPSIDSNTIRDTFSNQVGLISNMAVRFGEIEFSGDSNKVMKITKSNDGYKLTEGGVEDSLTANGCILVGLELDANKNGVHPSLKYYRAQNDLRKEYKKSLERGGESDSAGNTESNVIDKRWEEEKDYLYYKKQITSLKMFNDKLFKLSGETINAIQSNGTDTLETYTIIYKKNEREYSTKEFEVPTENNKSNLSNISRLPGECIKSFGLNIKEKKEFAKEKRDATKKTPLFWFQSKEVGFKCDEAILEEMKIIVKAYKDVKNVAQKLSDIYMDYKDAAYYGRAYNILLLQYADMSSKIKIPNPNNIGKEKESDNTVSEILLEAYNLVHEYVFEETNHCSAEEFLNRVINNKWLWVDKSSRKNVLKEKIFGNEKTVPDDIQALLTNFECMGFNLLYFIAKDVYFADKTKKYTVGDEDLMVEDFEKNNYSDKYNEMFTEQFEKRKSIGEINKMLLNACKDDLCALFVDKKNQLKYWKYSPFERNVHHFTYLKCDGKEYTNPDEIYQKLNELKSLSPSKRKKTHIEHIEEFIDRDDDQCKVDAAIAYLYTDTTTSKVSEEHAILKKKVDSDRKIFWQMFTWEEISRNLYIEAK